MSGVVSAMAVGAGLSIAASSSRNSAIAKQASANAAATGEMLLQNRNVTYNGIGQKAQNLNNQIGMELTQLNWEALKATGQMTSSTAERGIAGNTAARSQGQVDMQVALAADNIMQKGEAAMTDIQMEYDNAKYTYESGAFNNSIDYANAMNQQSTGMEMASSAFGSAMSFGSAASGLKSSFASTPKG